MNLTLDVCKFEGNRKRRGFSSLWTQDKKAENYDVIGFNPENDCFCEISEK